MKEVFDFSRALEALKNGGMITRLGWNGKDMFVFKQIPADIGLHIIPKMQSVPQRVKDHMLKKETNLKYTNQLAIVKPDGTVDSWIPSVSDLFAEDWTNF